MCLLSYGQLVISTSAQYDVFLSHNSADKPEVEAIGDRLRQERFNPFLDKWHLVPGKPWQTELTVALDASVCVAIFFGPNGDGPWHNQEMQLALLKAVRTNDDHRLIPVLLPGADPSQIDGFLELRTWVDFRPGLDDEAAFQRLVAAIKGVAPDSAEGLLELPDEPRPYRGIERFEGEQQQFFFGRDDEIRRLIERLEQDRCVAVVGASGSGKSSLARAGFYTDAAEQAQPGIREWRRIVLMPKNNPLLQLATNLVAHLPESERPALVKAFIDDFRNSPDGLITALTTLFPNPDQPVLLLVDQFEELFTQRPPAEQDQTEWRQRTARFAANLLAAVNHKLDWLRIVVTLRADFVDRFVDGDFPDFRTLLERRQFWLAAIGEDRLREVIVRPATLRGVFFEKGLVERILAEMPGEAVALPLLERFLGALWDQRRGPWLTHEAYDDIGGVGEALDNIGGVGEALDNIGGVGEALGDPTRMPRIELETPSGPDLIGIDADVEALASIVAAKNLVPPLAIGLFGDWGSGKSFFMKKLVDRVTFLAENAVRREIQNKQCAFHGRVAQIWFNAWNYVEANLWASLVTHIFESLHNRVEPRDPIEKKQWQRLLQRLDETSGLRDEVEEGLAAAERELNAAREIECTQVQQLAGAVATMWQELVKGDFGAHFSKVQKSLNTEELLEVKESLLLRREDTENLLRRLPVFRRTLAKGLGSVLALGAFGIALVVLLAVVFGIIRWIDNATLNGISGQIAAATALVGSISAWLGTAFRKATGVVDAVHAAGQAFERGLADGSIKNGTLRAAREAVERASEKVKDHEDQIGTLRRELGEHQASRRLTNFLANRAESSDYRKHLGLPAMIRRDFEHLQALMDEMSPKSFKLTVSARDMLVTIAREQHQMANTAGQAAADAGVERAKMPVELFDKLRKHRLDMGPMPEVIDNNDHLTVRDHERDFKVRVEPDGTCTLSWQRLRIDRIVLYIDDLDRCPSDRVVDVLQAIRLLLDFELFVVVVGVDARWVTQALQTHHQKQWQHETAGQVAEAAEPQDFLEKIFQIPLWLEPLVVEGTRRYLQGLTQGVTESETGHENDSEKLSDSDGLDQPAGNANTDDFDGTDRAEKETAPPAISEADRAIGKKYGAAEDAGNATEERPVEDNQGGTAVEADETAKLNVQDADNLDASSDGGPGDSVMNPPGLELDKRENEFMLKLAGVMGRSPRAVKRFVNVYRLIRAGITGPALEAFIGTEKHPGSYKAAQFLLAVIVGTPAIAEQLFNQIRSGHVSDLLKYGNEQIADQQTASAKRADWEKIVALFEPQKDGTVSIDEIQQHLKDRVDQIGRYSFRFGRR